MRWLALVFVLALAPACTTKSETPDAEQADKKAKKAGDKKAGEKKAGDKAGAQKKAGDKTAATKATQQKATQQKGAQQKGEKKPPVVYGAAGPVYGELKLEEKEVGEKTRTAAQLALTAGEKAEVVRLGAIAGTCTEAAELATVSDVLSLWTVDCETEQGKATVAITQDGDSLLVARAAAGTSEYKQIRKFQLAKGAEVSRKQ